MTTKDVDSGQAPPPEGVVAARQADDVALLEETFHQLRQRIEQQWQEQTREEQARRELVANISHDLRTPLTSLHGYLETLVLKDAHLSDGDRRRYLLTALDQSVKVGALAQSLFDLARLEAGAVQPQKEAFQLADLVQDLFQKFELATEARGQRMVATIASGLPPAWADLGLIERVLTNLLDNAVRHGAPGGRIEVTLAPAPGQRIGVQVSDEGPGIPPERRDTLFSWAGSWGRASASWPLEPGRRGGLGLATVQGILRLHGSRARLVDTDRPGATFRFELEAAGPAAGGSAVGEHAAGGSAAGGSAAGMSPAAGAAAVSDAASGRGDRSPAAH